MPEIDARLALPGTLFTDPFGHTEGVFVLETVLVEDTYPHGGEFSEEAVPAVTLLAHRQEDGTTPIHRVLDVGQHVFVVPAPPVLVTSYDEEDRQWVARVDTTDSPHLNLSLELNDAPIYDGDVDAEQPAWAAELVGQLKPKALTDGAWVEVLDGATNSGNGTGQRPPAGTIALVRSDNGRVIDSDGDVWIQTVGTSYYVHPEFLRVV